MKLISFERQVNQDLFYYILERSEKMIIFIGLLILAYIMGGITMVLIEANGKDEEGEGDEE